ncbi:MAG: NAD(P)/FAD-dependent oxidoreductase, partial [Bacteroidetes bacterium]|nr:NAD(P)/FAD-dependent oxidoreductase [Bacteroidota bacterium]
WPFLPKELQRAKGLIAQTYAGALFDDYKGIYIIGTTQPRGGLGSLATPGAEYIARVIQLQEKTSVPMGFVFKRMGQKIPTTHIQSPTEIFRKLKLLKMIWPVIEKRAEGLSKRHEGFTNTPLPGLPKTKIKDYKEMVIY